MSERGPTQLRFDDGKDAQALRTIGEVANALGLRQHVLRYWEQQFPTLQPLKRSGGRRYYRPEDVALVQTIDRLVNREGYTLKGARQALAGGAAGAGEPRETASSQLGAQADILPHLRVIRARLARALEAA
jgi:DNA-binding transcriptional MerR regulator